MKTRTEKLVDGGVRAILFGLFYTIIVIVAKTKFPEYQWEIITGWMCLFLADCIADKGE